MNILNIEQGTEEYKNLTKEQRIMIITNNEKLFLEYRNELQRKVWEVFWNRKKIKVLNTNPFGNSLYLRVWNIRKYELNRVLDGIDKEYEQLKHDQYAFGYLYYTHEQMMKKLKDRYDWLVDLYKFTPHQLDKLEQDHLKAIKEMKE